ncbi:RNA-directed DNA polymerase from mobile element jockey [Aphis craccivora]|uniref:RNA-directed DNA polymerase from mobile element jockey n=1 Tax=Aphis craccivora TaxID=307492 RepID=A0A6G0Y2K0_APHCR|nr:RNA-directed DNA polymerase from mobile element jockey [Aphis craccivora]
MLLCDRSSQSSSFNRGGRVLVAIRNDVVYNLLPALINNVEYLFVKFYVNNTAYIVCSVYVPPSSPIPVFESFMPAAQYIIDANLGSLFIFSGDLNLPDLSWSNDDFGLIYSSSGPAIHCVPDVFAYNNFFQLNHIPNSYGNFLDLVFSNDSRINIEKSVTGVVPCDPYHPALVFMLTFVDDLPSFDSCHKYYNFRKACYTRISASLSSFNWLETLTTTDIDSATCALYDALHYCVTSFVSLVVFKPSKFPSWSPKNLKNIVFAKKEMHAKYKASRNPVNCNKFSNLRAQYKYYYKKCYKTFLDNTENMLKVNPRLFWDFVSKCRSSNGIPNSVHLNDLSATGPESISSLFSSYFNSVYVPSSANSLPVIPFVQHTLPSDCIFGVDDVENGLAALKNVHSVGPDGLSGTFLYNIRSVLCFPLWLLFRRSMDEGIFPLMLKISSVTSVFKSGDKSNVKKYRPISILKRVQKRFLSSAAYMLKIVHPPHDYTPVLRAVSLTSLADRRVKANLTFLKKLIDDSLNAPSLLVQVNFKVPHRATRSRVPFTVPLHCIIYGNLKLLVDNSKNTHKQEYEKIHCEGAENIRALNKKDLALDAEKCLKINNMFKPVCETMPDGTVNTKRAVSASGIPQFGNVSPSCSKDVFNYSGDSNNEHMVKRPKSNEIKQFFDFHPIKDFNKTEQQPFNYKTTFFFQPDGINDHENSRNHYHYVYTYMMHTKEKSIDVLLFKYQLTKRMQEVGHRRMIFQRIVDVIKLIGKRGLSSQGAYESAKDLANINVSHGNFLDILLLLAKYDAPLDEHIKLVIKKASNNKTPRRNNSIDVKKCIGSSTNGASNMIGQYNGFSKWLEKESPKQLHVWCYAHCLNLVIIEATGVSTPAISLFGLLNSCATFFRDSHKRMDLWHDLSSNSRTDGMFILLVQQMAGKIFVKWAYELIENEDEINNLIPDNLPNVWIRKKKTLDGENQNETVTETAIDLFKFNVHNTAMDTVICKLEQRFAKHAEICSDFTCLDPRQFSKLLPTTALFKLS